MAKAETRSGRRGAKHAAARGPRIVIVRPGDSLGGIADRNGVTIAQLKRANNLKSAHVRAGQRLRIPQG